MSDFNRDLPPTADQPPEVEPIERISVEQFLVLYPEFKPLLSDEDFSEDFLQVVLNQARLEIELGNWNLGIRHASVYLLAAHHLQTQFELQASNANTAVQASKGSTVSIKPSESATLEKTPYGQQLRRLQQQARRYGGLDV